MLTPAIDKLKGGGVRSKQSHERRRGYFPVASDQTWLATRAMQIVKHQRHNSSSVKIGFGDLKRSALPAIPYRLFKLLNLRSFRSLGSNLDRQSKPQSLDGVFSVLRLVASFIRFGGDSCWLVQYYHGAADLVAVLTSRSTAAKSRLSALTEQIVNRNDRGMRSGYRLNISQRVRTWPRRFDIWLARLIHQKPH